MEAFSDKYIEFNDFQLQQPLWENIEKLVECSEERTEIKKVVGHSIVDENLDLHTELLTLYDIWRETQQDDTTDIHKSVLPEPPFLRENLEKQITLLVELLKQKMKRGDESVNLTEEDRRLIKSVSSDRLSKNGSRQSSRDTPSSGYESSRCSSVLSVDLNSLQESMTISDIDSIVQPLREDFEDERKLLLKDITYIQNVLIYESDMKESEKQKRQSSPSIKELQSLTNRLEKQVLEKKKVKPAPPPATKKALQRSSLSRSPKLKPIKPTTMNFADETPSNTPNNNNNNTISKYTPSPPSTANKDRGKIPTPPCVERKERTKTSQAIRHSIKLKNKSEAGMVS